MIQRKQTIYLLFAGLITVILLFIPFGTFNIEGSACFEYNAFAVKTISEKQAIMHPLPIGNAVLLIITSILSFITIFLYKNRKLQLRLISVNMLVVLVAIFAIVYIYPNFIFSKNINLAGAELKYNYVIIISFISAVGLYLAKKAIMKDEAMIRSADRLR
jgi:cation transport ATPase